MEQTFIFVIGTRAQLIKVAPILVECERRGLSAIVLMTGQHHETMQDLIQEFRITSPQIAALPATEHSTIRSLLRWLPAAYKGVKNRLREIGGEQTVLVHGDTLSTLLGAIVGRRCGAKVVHLESGLSSGRLLDPFPEEICRRLVFRMTDVAMCPSTEAVNYMKDNYKTEVVDTAGNTIVDAVALTGAAEVQRNIGAPYLVVSLHRFQNIYKKRRLVHLVSLMEDLSARFDVNFVLHPATRRRLESYKLLDRLSLITRIHLRPRMGYKDFLYLAAGAECVLTDGGSNQEELAALGVPTIVMRAHTERLDGLGANIVMEADVKMGVKELILTGGHEDLRYLPAALPSHSPSTRIVGALLGGHLDTHR